MKFSDIRNEGDWTGLKPYLDTCLLPYTGLSGDEGPWEVTERLEALRDAMALIELPYKGRVVTYPSIQYRALSDEASGLEINRLAHELKQTHFRFVLTVTCLTAPAGWNLDHVDLVLDNAVFAAADPKAFIAERLQQLWNKSASESS